MHLSVVCPLTGGGGTSHQNFTSVNFTEFGIFNQILPRFIKFCIKVFPEGVGQNTDPTENGLLLKIIFLMSTI